MDSIARATAMKAEMKMLAEACPCGSHETRELWTGPELDRVIVLCSGCGSPLDRTSE